MKDSRPKTEQKKPSKETSFSRLFPDFAPRRSPLVGQCEIIPEFTRDILKYTLRSSLGIQNSRVKSGVADSRLSEIIALHCEEDGSASILEELAYQTCRDLNVEFYSLDQGELFYAINLAMMTKTRDGHVPVSSAEPNQEQMMDDDLDDDPDVEEDSEDLLAEKLKKLVQLGQSGKPVKGLMILPQSGSLHNANTPYSKAVKEVCNMLCTNLKQRPVVLYINNFGLVDAQRKSDLVNALKQSLSSIHDASRVVVMFSNHSEISDSAFQVIEVTKGNTPQWKRLMEDGKKSQRAMANFYTLKHAAKRRGLGLGVIESDIGQNLFFQERLYRYAEMKKIIGVAHGQADSSFVTTDAVEKALHLFEQSRNNIQVSAKSIQDRLAERGISVDQYEKKLLSSIVTPDSIKTKFDDVICAPQTKEMLQSIISLPLRRPELFYGALKGTTSGVLLFGPPGTGKSLLARAISSECDSTFLNITASSIFQMYVGEGEKTAKAVFTLARKLSPCVIFLDEMDSLLDARDSSRSYSTKREIINEFMAEWDGVASRNDGIIVIGASNRPFDLDDAVLRRMPRRILVDLPNATQRQEILRTHLKDETCDADFDELSAKTELYSGSDLKNVCISAAMAAVKELIARENEDGQTESRILSKRHFDQALCEITPSVSETQESLERLRKWNMTFGDSSIKKHIARKFGF